MLPGAAVPGVFVRAVRGPGWGTARPAARTSVPLAQFPRRTMTSTQSTRRTRRRAIIRETVSPWSRAWRRAISRDEARKHAHYNGPAPRYEPVRNDTCTQHHRQLPCKRCTEAGAE